MASVSVVSRQDISPRLLRDACIALTLLMAAVVTHVGFIGDPATYDEQFYLVVADRMWHGALPYVDIWDRKPILLFLIYAAFRPFSSDGIVACQIGAMLFATMTAFVIVVVARRFANSRGAWLAGLAYLLYLPLLHGRGGQSPVFYNLFLVLAAWEVIRADETDDTKGIFWHGLRSMLWAGLAIQVKYTAAIDGIAFGLWLIFLLVRQRENSILKIVAHAGIWATIALIPTLLATGFYVAIGHGQEFAQANFLSIFQKHQPSDFGESDIIFLTSVKLSALLFFSVFAFPVLLRSKAGGAPVAFLLLWIVFAIIDFISIGNYYDHYAIPLLAPMIVAFAPLLGTSIGGPAGMALFGWASLMAMDFFSNETKQFHQRQVAAMFEAVQPYATQGCIYLHDGPPILYLLTESCLPSRYAFPAHLNEIAESEATNAPVTMAALIATRPSAVWVMTNPPVLHPPNLVTAAMLDAALARDYQPVAKIADVFPDRQLILYARKDLVPLEETQH